MIFSKSLWNNFYQESKFKRSEPKILLKLQHYILLSGSLKFILNKLIFIYSAEY